MAEVFYYVACSARGQIFYIILQQLEKQDPNENWIGQPTVNLDALLCLLLQLLLVSRSSSRTKKGDIFIDLCRLEQVVCLAIAVSAKTAFALFSPLYLDCASPQ